MGRPRLADRRGEVVGEDILPDSEPAGHCFRRSGVHAGDRDPAEVAGADARRLQRRLEGLRPERHVAGLPESLLPHPRPALARGAPAVEELVARRRAPEVLGEDRSARLVLAHHDRGRRVTAGRLVGRGRQAVAEIRARQKGRPAPLERSDERAHPRAKRAAEVERPHASVEAEGGVDRGGIGLVEVGGRGRREPEPRGAGAGHRPEREARGLDAHGRGVLVVRGHAPAALATAAAEEPGDRGALEASVGHVARDAHDASHGVTLLSAHSGSAGRARAPLAPSGRSSYDDHII